MNAISMLLEAKKGENYVFTTVEMKVFVATLKKEVTEPLRRIIEGLECYPYPCGCCQVCKAKQKAREE